MVNRNAPLAVRGTRLAIRKGLDLPLHEAEIMAEAFRERVVRTDDAKEGPRAFVEKRDPMWRCRDERRDASRRSVYETSDDHVATITLNRPEVLNAFDRQMCEEMRDAWQLVKDDPSVHAVVLRAAGDRAFCAGLDTKQAVRPARRRVEPRRSRRAAQPEVAAGVEAGGLRGARDLHRGRVLLRQRSRHRHLLRRRDVLRLARHLRAGVGARTGRAHAQGSAWARRCASRCPATTSA